LRILITGAYGFIGSYITAALLKDGFEVVCAVRDTERAKLKFPLCKIIHCDFNKDTDVSLWQERLKDIDIVINVVGVLQSKPNNNIENIHYNVPKALFDACVKSEIKKIIHISALGIDDERTTSYSITKKSADNYLKTLQNIDWVILQPSLVYASGCYGGTTLLRSLASLPFIIPVVGDGEQKFQPIHMEDLTKTVVYFVKLESITQKSVKVVGPEAISVKDILVKFRSWLGLRPAKVIKIPDILIRMLVKIGDLINAEPLNTTSYRMMKHGNTANPADFINLTNIHPRSLDQGLAQEPLTIQSLWHARLYMVRPLITWGLALFWIYTGVITLSIVPDKGLSILEELGVHSKILHPLFYFSCVVDVFLGMALLVGYKRGLIGIMQIVAILAYTAFISIMKPSLWLDPLGSISKNIPILILTLVMLIIERDK
jgi:nucleoside-diphosphate-sugar epimerase